MQKQPNKHSLLLDHLVELRARLIRMLLFFAVTLLICMHYASELYSLLAHPLMHLLPEGSAMIATEVASPFLAPFRLSLYLSLFITMPFALQQFWQFLVPGLYPSERKLFLPLLLCSIGLFYLGLAFAYFLVLPIIFNFFIHTAPSGIQIMTDINAYLDFLMSVLLAFGFAFQCPVITCLIIKLNLVKADTLKNKRPYIIIGSFVVAMFLTPPDVVSQTLLAIPLWLLFELGLGLSRWLFTQPLPSP